MDARAERRRQPPGGYVVVLLLRLVAILQLALPHLITPSKMPQLNWTAAWHPPMVYTYDAVAAFTILRAG
jgi:hypothetical protein